MRAVLLEIEVKVNVHKLDTENKVQRRVCAPSRGLKDLALEKCALLALKDGAAEERSLKPLKIFFWNADNESPPDNTFI